MRILMVIIIGNWYNTIRSGSFDYSHKAFRLLALCFSISRIIKTTKKPHILRFLPWLGIVEYVALLILHFLLASVGDLQK